MYSGVTNQWWDIKAHVVQVDGNPVLQPFQSARDIQHIIGEQAANLGIPEETIAKTLHLVTPGSFDTQGFRLDLGMVKSGLNQSTETVVYVNPAFTEWVEKQA